MDDWRIDLFLAVRAAHRALGQCSPTLKLKRQRNTLQKLVDALCLAAELAAKGEATPAFRRHLLHTANAVGSIHDDVHYGPNDLDLPCDEPNPASSVRSVLMSAVDAIFWLESNLHGSHDAQQSADTSFRDHVGAALRAGVPSDSDAELARIYDWSSMQASAVVIGEDGLVCIRQSSN